jgi:hypothetical protein
MEYIEISRNDPKVWHEKTTSDSMEGLLILLQDSSYCVSLDEIGTREEYKDDRLEFSTDFFSLKSIGKNLVEVCGFDYDNEENGTYTVIILPKDALWKFAALYKAAEKDKNWTTLKVGFDGKQFKLWLDGEEYDSDSNKLEKNK